MDQMQIQELVIEGEDLPDGESMRTQCPSCAGGLSGERSFVLTREDNYLWFVCHRASCGEAGRFRMSGPPVPSQRKPKTRKTIDDAVRLPDGIHDWLCMRFQLDGEQIVRQGVQWSPAKQRVMFPVRGLRGDFVGWWGRHYDELFTMDQQDLRGRPKVVAYYERPDNFTLNYPVGSLSDTVVLVEDYVSMLRFLQNGVYCVALGGTHLQDRAMVELAEAGFDKAEVVLDNDAWSKGIQIARQLSGLVPARPLYVQADPKDMTQTQMQDILEKI